MPPPKPLANSPANLGQPKGGPGDGQKSLKKLSEADLGWYCHCCGLKNVEGTSKCSVCGRPESYVLAGLPMPLHGEGGMLFRPSQVPNVLENLHEADSEGWTPLHSACVNNNASLALDLLRYGSIVEAITHKGLTALHLSVYSGCDPVVEELVLTYNADINAKTKFEHITPLHISCQLGRLNITKLLIENGADVNAKNILEKTPLHFAAEIGRADLGSLLMQAGSEPNALDAHGWTPRQVAELNGHRMFEELIVRATSVDKQVVFNKLPTAPWHNDVWFEVIKMQSVRQKEDSIEKAKWAKCEEEVTKAKAIDKARKDKLKEASRIKELEDRAKRKEAEGGNKNPTNNRYLDIFDVYGMIKPRHLTEEEQLNKNQAEKRLVQPAPESILGLDSHNKQRIWSLDDRLRQRANQKTVRSHAYQCLVLQELNRGPPNLGATAEKTFLEFDSIVHKISEEANKKVGANLVNVDSVAAENGSHKKKGSKGKRGRKSTDVSETSSVSLSVEEGTISSVGGSVDQCKLPVEESQQSNHVANAANTTVLPLTIENIGTITAPPSERNSRIHSANVNIKPEENTHASVLQLKDTIDTLLPSGQVSNSMIRTSASFEIEHIASKPFNNIQFKPPSNSTIPEGYLPSPNFNINNFQDTLTNRSIADSEINDNASTISALTDAD